MRSLLPQHCLRHAQARTRNISCRAIALLPNARTASFRLSTCQPAVEWLSRRPCAHAYSRATTSRCALPSWSTLERIRLQLNAATRASACTTSCSIYLSKSTMKHICRASTSTRSRAASSSSKYQTVPILHPSPRTLRQLCILHQAWPPHPYVHHRRRIRQHRARQPGRQPHPSAQWPANPL